MKFHLTWVPKLEVSHRAALFALIFIAITACLPALADDAIRGDLPLSSLPFKKDDAAGGAGDAAAWQVGGVLGTLAVGLGAWIVHERRNRRRQGSRVATEAKAGAWTFLGLLGSSSRSPHLRLITSTRLSPQHSIHEVEWNGQRLLIGCSSTSMNLLASQPGLGGEPLPAAGAETVKEGLR